MTINSIGEKVESLISWTIIVSLISIFLWLNDGILASFLQSEYYLFLPELLLSFALIWVAKNFLPNFNQFTLLGLGIGIIGTFLIAHQFWVLEVPLLGLVSKGTIFLVNVILFSSVFALFVQTAISTGRAIIQFEKQPPWTAYFAIGLSVQLFLFSFLALLGLLNIFVCGIILMVPIWLDRKAILSQFRRI